MNDAGRAPILLIDTVDVALNTKGKDDHLRVLLSELAMAGLRTLVASRPGEARQLVSLGCRTMRLMEYSDPEFVAAVGAYARAFVTGGDGFDAEVHATALLQAAAQGYPIKEICRNPLTLRMLYTIYAPRNINITEIDVVSLYRAFWHRRVEADIRTDGGATVPTESDLSHAAMQAAVTMLVEGLPEVQLDMLTRELENSSLNGRDLHALVGRGVLRISDYGVDRRIGFFHQTFFEHAAAIAILRLGKRPALDALFERWAKYNGNLFLGATLERALVLAELEIMPVRIASERLLLTLLDHGPAGLNILAYTYVHRSAVPVVVENRLRDQIASNDALVIERLLELAANAASARRPALIKILGLILDTGNSRWTRSALELLLRFATPDLDMVAGLVRGKGLTQFFIDNATFPQARDLFIEFLGRYFERDPEWVLDQCALLFIDAVRRRADPT